VRRAAELGVAGRPQDGEREPAALVLERVDRYVGQAAPPRALVRGIGGQLHDVRRPRQPRAGSAPTEHSRRVDGVGEPRAAGDERTSDDVPRAWRQPPRHPVHPVRQERRRRGCGRHRLDSVPAAAQPLRDLGGVRGRPADVGRPDPADDEHPHA
jgi:hypothetical protein